MSSRVFHICGAGPDWKLLASQGAQFDNKRENAVAVVDTSAAHSCLEQEEWLHAAMFAKTDAVDEVAHAARDPFGMVVTAGNAARAHSVVY